MAASSLQQQQLYYTPQEQHSSITSSQAWLQLGML